MSTVGEPQAQARPQGDRKQRIEKGISDWLRQTGTYFNRGKDLDALVEAIDAALKDGDQ